MKKNISSIILLVLLTVQVNCLAQKAIPETVTYEFFRGTLGTYPIQLNYSIRNGTVTGSYFYEKIGTPISLTGSVRDKAVKLNTENSTKNETFTLAFSGQNLNGSWKVQGGTKSLPVTLTRTVVPKQFDYYEFTDSLLLRPAMKESPGCNFQVRTIWPIGESETDNFIRNKLISQFFQDKKFRYETDAPSIIEEYKRKIFDAYQSEFADTKDSDISEMSFSFNADNYTSIDVQFYSSNLLSLSAINYIYSGGAHGMTGIGYINLDLNQKKELRLEDVISKAGINKLPALIEKKFRSDNKLSPTASLQKAGLFENKITTFPESFYLTNKSIGFVYNQYEIAPYAMGHIEVVLPYSSLTGLLQPSFMKLIQ